MSDIQTEIKNLLERYKANDCSAYANCDDAPKDNRGFNDCSQCKAKEQMDVEYLQLFVELFNQNGGQTVECATPVMDDKAIDGDIQRLKDYLIKEYGYLDKSIGETVVGIIKDLRQSNADLPEPLLATDFEIDKDKLHQLLQDITFKTEVSGETLELSIVAVPDKVQWQMFNQAIDDNEDIIKLKQQEENNESKVSETNE